MLDVIPHASTAQPVTLGKGRVVEENCTIVMHEISLNALKDSQTMILPATATQEEYRVTRIGEIGQNSKTLILKIIHSHRVEHETALKIPHPRLEHLWTADQWVTASRAWLEEFSIHRQLCTSDDERKVGES